MNKALAVVVFSLLLVTNAFAGTVCVNAANGCGIADGIGSNPC